jgi:hypothetical protein
MTNPVISRFRQEDPVDTVLESYARDGAVIVEDLVGAELVEELRRDFEGHLNPEPWCNRDLPIPVEWFGAKTKRLHGLLGRAPRFAEVAGHAWSDAICRRLLGGHCSDHRIAITELIAIGPGEQRQPIHRDSDSWPHLPTPRGEALVVLMLALTDFTQDNGGTLVVPGSHRWPATREPEDHEVIGAAMTRGSALVFSGDVLHGGGANQTSSIRVGAYVGYALGWLRPLEQHVLTSGLEAIRAAPARVRQLLGHVDAGWEPGF